MDEPTPRVVERFDLTHPPAGFVDDPFPWYAALRQTDPIHRCPDGSYLVTRYDDCLQVYRNSNFSSDKRRLFKPKFGASPLFNHHTTSLVFNDPPYHTRVRATLAEALKPKTIEPTIVVLERVVAKLLDELAERFSGGNEVDLIEHFASRVPVEIISSLLTVPEEDRDNLRRWSLAILGALEPELTAEQLALGNRAVTEFLDYLRALVKYRRSHPSGAPNDVLATLTALHDRGELREAELLHNCIFLLNAGHETTTNLIGNGVHCLLHEPGAREQLRAPTGVDQRRHRGNAALRQPEPARQSRSVGGDADRRSDVRARRADHAVHRRREPRPGAIRPTGTVRRRTHAESSPRVRERHSRVCRYVAGAHRRQGCDCRPP